MDLEFVIKRMWAGANSIQALTTNVDDEQARWKPSPDRWSVLEVICHLHDEERYDFRSHFSLGVSGRRRDALLCVRRLRRSRAAEPFWRAKC